MSKVWTVAGILLLALIVFISYQATQDNSCRTAALNASVDAYPIDQYPDTSVRGIKQKDYESRYIGDNCQ
jgi:hypothetical protein